MLRFLYEMIYIRWCSSIYDDDDEEDDEEANHGDLITVADELNE